MTSRCQQCQKKFDGKGLGKLCPNCRAELRMSFAIHWQPVLGTALVSLVMLVVLMVGVAWYQTEPEVAAEIKHDMDVNEMEDHPKLPSAEVEMAPREPALQVEKEPDWPAIPIGTRPGPPSFQRWIGGQLKRGMKGLQSASRKVAVRRDREEIGAKEGVNAPEDPPEVAEIVVERVAKPALKRRRNWTEEELRRQIETAVEVSERDIPLSTRQQLWRSAKSERLRDEETLDVAALPIRMGVDCRLGHEAAQELELYSHKARAALVKSLRNGRDTRVSYGLLSRKLAGREWRAPEAVSTLEHVFMAESRDARSVLVEQLAEIDDPKSTAALARRAVFDLASGVRDEAVHALKNRRAADYRPVFLSAFRHPWPAAAEHAADALIQLQDRDALSDLVDLLREPDPGKPHLRKAQDSQAYVRELVRINHLQNCQLCHAPSTNLKDPVRTAVPSRSLPLDLLRALEYNPNGGTVSIRADITFLHSDFAVYQPVVGQGDWPANQRFDYVVRDRPLSRADLLFYTETVNIAGVERVQSIQPGAHVGESRHAQRDSVLYALRELTGKDAGISTKSWEDLRKEGKLR